MDSAEPVEPSQHRSVVRYLLPILGLLLLVGGLVTVKFSQISSLISAGKEYQKNGPPPEIVSTAPAQTQTWEGTLTAVGSIAAAKGVTISNDAPGVVNRISFESGALVRQGQVLVELDSSVERAQLASAQARRDLAQITLGRTKALANSNSIPLSQVDTDEAQVKTSSTDYTALQAQIDRKIVRAPFAGRLGIRLVNIGQYLNPGTPLTVLESTDSVYVDFSLPQQNLPDIKVGLAVRVTLEAAKDTTYDGVIAAVEPQVDATTRTIKVRASVPNKGEKLRPGMFATVAIVLPPRPPSVVIPVTSIVHASFGDSIFIVEDKKDDAGAPVAGADGKPVKVARQQFVKVADTRGDFVAIADGVTAGQDVVTSGAFKLRNGTGVAVNNDIKLNPDLAPHPVNR
jgi:membrane fusion protein, multidrug efflux system